MKIHYDQSQSVTIDGSNLKKVEKFIYLGSEIMQDGDVGNEVGIRIGKAGSSFRVFQKMRNTHNVTLLTKLKLFNSISFLY